MASASTIDTAATGSGLRAANETTGQAIAAGVPTNPAGTYIASTSATLSGLLAGALGALEEKVSTATVATEATVLQFDSTEAANTTALST